MSTETTDRVRLDIWLWAARFFRTRSLAKAAIDGSKVQVNGTRCKAGREIRTGDLLVVRRGHEQMEVEVTALATQRRGAPEAARLYQETATSRSRREQEAEQHRAARAMMTPPPRRPDKKQRRHIIRFRQQDPRK